MRMVSLVLAALLPSIALADLKLGDKAPSIDITSWVRGDAVKLGDARRKKVVVLEFWATWCGPCRTSIPHLTELQKKHAKEAVIIGVTKPDPSNSLEKVKEFVEDWGEKMDYTVAFDGDAKTYESYMTATGQRGIPTAFIIDKEGRLAWLGHPLRMDEPLKQVIDGTFDIEKAAAAQKIREQVTQLEREFFEKVLAGDADAAGEVAEKIIDLAKDDAGTLNRLAWTMLTHPRLQGEFNKLALSAAKRCHEVTGGDNWMYIDTFALARFENGDLKAAVELQRKAIELAKKDGAPEAALREFQERLERFEKAAQPDSDES